QLDALTDAIAEAVEGKVLTREQLMRAIARQKKFKTLSAKILESSWGTILKPAAFNGRLCFGPNVGPRVQFTSPATWLAEAGHTLGPRPDAPEAMAAIVRRYLAAYAPAAVHDLARWWNGTGVLSARQWIAALGDEVAEVDVEGTPCWMLAADVRSARETERLRAVRLLPAFDPYVVAASWHAERLLPGPFRPRVYRTAGWISPVLLVNGRMAGVWSHKVEGSTVKVAIEPLAPIPVWARRAAVSEAERLAAFLGCKLQLT